MADLPRYKITIETCVEAVSAAQAYALSQIAADAATEAVSRHYTPAPDDGALYTYDVAGVDLDAHEEIQLFRNDHDPNKRQCLIDEEQERLLDAWDNS